MLYHGNVVLRVGGDIHYDAETSFARLDERSLVIEFSGISAEHGAYRASCRLVRDEDGLSGRGEYKDTGSDLLASTVMGRLTEEADGTLKVVGTWHDDHDPDPYDIAIQLMPVVPTGGS